MPQYDENSRGPLDGVRILDLSRLVAGNMVTHVLADQGADVIKVEYPQKGDDLRNWRVEGVEIYWKVYSRNKRSMALDIKTESGKDILLRLVETADVVVENFVPGTLERWGLGPDALHRRNPGLVILRISGWGQTGPYAKRPGFGTLVEAMSGYAHLNGYPDRPPVLPPLAMADMVAGLYGSSAVLAALRHAVRGEKGGQVIDLSLFEPIFSMIGAEAAQYRLTGVPSNRAGNQSTHTAPRNVYVCSDGKYVAMSGSMQSMAERIFTTIGHPELIADPRFRTNDDRVRNRDELDLIIGAVIATRTQEQNLDLFEAAGVTVGPVCSIADLVDHPFVRGRGVIVELPDEDMGTLPMHNVIPRMSGTPGGMRRPAPRLGQHNAEILAELGVATAAHEREMPA
ncbi:CoA transferase (plasmid) [Skermanella mucosa]|uniref:CaiB/BaiF CoA transferase family protein n=1 Tax=Skermanella mucosa TaxID=1789672 RepID=UPI00192CB816|nr:CoA transferase [Skermanella mucosa]UEM24242.1 CoA transferase [Skermanella mucosa]